MQAGSLYVTGSEKGTTSCYSRNFIIFFFNAYISGTIAATNLNFGMNILPSSCYTRKEFRAPPISSMGGAQSCVDRIRKLPFYASLWQLIAWDSFVYLLTLDLWSRRPKLSTNQVRSLGLLRPSVCTQGLDFTDISYTESPTLNCDVNATG